MVFFYLFLALLGLVVGSFLGVLYYRIPRGISILGRSYCDSCKRPVPWYENIPVLGYFFLRGKCSFCKKPITPFYPFIEGLTALSFFATGFLWLNPASPGLAAAFKNGLGVAAFAFFLFLAAVFIVLIVIDYEYQVLPDEILFPALAVLLLALLALPSPLFYQHLLWGFASFLFFLLIYLLTRGRGMGFGDVKLSFFLGSLLGFPGTPVFLFLAFLTGAFSGLLLVFLKRASFGRPVPFGPYLLVSAYAALFYADLIWDWYMGLL